jgi:hypothetical protein
MSSSSQDRCPFCGAKHECKGCHAPVPANLDHEGVCANCLEWRYRPVPRLKADDPNVVSRVRVNNCPEWRRLPLVETLMLKRACQPDGQGAGKGRKGKRGRPRRSTDRLNEYRDIKERWDRAKAAGVSKAQFCADQRIETETLETALRTCRNKESP